MKLPWLLISFGIGQLGSAHAARRRRAAGSGRSRLRSSAAGRDRSRQSGSSRSRPIGSNDRAGEDMRADLRALLDHDDRQAGVELLEPDRRRQAGRAGADDRRRRIPSPRAPAVRLLPPCPLSSRPGARPARAALKRRALLAHIVGDCRSPLRRRAAGMLEAAIPQRARFAMASSNRSTPLDRRRRAPRPCAGGSRPASISRSTRRPHDRFAESAAPAAAPRAGARSTPPAAPPASYEARPAPAAAARARRSGALGARAAPPPRRRSTNCAPRWSASTAAA